MKERAIGEVFEWEGQRYAVKKVRFASCRKCALRDEAFRTCIRARETRGPCTSGKRSDGNDVTFILAVPA